MQHRRHVARGGNHEIAGKSDLFQNRKGRVSLLLSDPATGFPEPFY